MFTVFRWRHIYKWCAFESGGREHIFSKEVASPNILRDRSPQSLFVEIPFACNMAVSVIGQFTIHNPFYFVRLKAPVRAGLDKFRPLRVCLDSSMQGEPNVEKRLRLQVYSDRASAGNL